MRLGAFFNPTGHHVASWRHPDAQADAGVNFAHYVELAQSAERGKFDFVFFADNVNVREARPEALSRSAQYIANFEPLTLIAGLAAVTSRIGFVSTASTSWNEPYNIARKFASLDHISGGRVAWNIVTSSVDGEARNFGRERLEDHAVRYERAREFTQVVCDLWDSWADDAFVRDKESGLFFDPEKVRSLDHRGAFYSVAGPLNVPRPPQGHPVLVQAGSSNDGRAFAAEFAEAVFGNPLTIEWAQSYYADLKGRAATFGRAPESILIMPGISTYVGRTAKEAQELYDEMQARVDPVVGIEMLSAVLGVDVSGYPIDGPLPELDRSHVGSQASFDNWTELARTQKLSIRELCLRVVGARGKSVIVGSAVQIADHMQNWFENGAADGFNIMAPYLPGQHDAFVELVIPELQARGLFRTEYEGVTLRENLGLARPERKPGREAAHV
jgi:FMN-dependent oxidoreductase (nitrilotriacetate monooxygenase family)